MADRRLGIMARAALVLSVSCTRPGPNIVEPGGVKDRTLAYQSSKPEGGDGGCGIVECIRAIECVQRCGGPILTSGCCPCPSGSADRAILCGAAGVPTP
jgi:hypothetical protein